MASVQPTATRMTRAPSRVTMKQVKPQVRLETLGAKGTRAVLCCTYITLVVAIVLTVVLKLQYDTSTILLGSPPCEGPVPTVLDSPSPTYSCVGPGAGINGTQWNAQVVDMSPLSGDIDILLNIGDATLEGVTAGPFVYSSTVEGLAHDHWELLWTIANATVGLDCQSPSDDCAPVTVINSFLTTHGQGGGGFPQYRMSVHYSTNLTLFGDVSYTFRYRLGAFRVGDTVLRGVLLLITVVVFWRFTRAVARTGVPFAQWMPHRKWVLYLLVALFLWQNPISVAVSMLNTVPTVVRVVSLCLQGLGWAGIFVYWIMVMDSLKYEPAMLPKWFYCWKVTFGVVFGTVLVALQLVKNAGPLFFKGSHFEHPANLLWVSLLVGSVFALCLLGWLVWFICTTRSTRKALDKMPYAATRFRQLAYRFLVFQQLLVTLFAFAVNAAPVVTFFIQYIKHPHASSGPNDTATTSTAEWVSNIVGSLAAGYQPTGEVLLLSVYVYMVALTFSPPTTPKKKDVLVTTMQPRQSMSHAALRRMGLDRVGSALDMIGTVLGVSTVDLASLRFNLVTACWLFDLSWAVYFDPVGHTTASSFGSFEGLPHGFVLEAFLHDLVTDTSGFVARKGERVVVAFRGTASKKNFMTDLKVARGTVQFEDDKHGIISAVPGVREALPLLHSGFWRAYSSIREPLQAAVRSALVAAGPTARLFLTGHSLGGALATIAAVDLKPIMKATQHAFSLLPSSMRTVGPDSSAGLTVRRPHSPDLEPLDVSPLPALTPSSPDSVTNSGRQLTKPLLARDHLRRGPQYTGVVQSSRDGADVATGWWTDDAPSPEPAVGAGAPAAAVTTVNPMADPGAAQDPSASMTTETSRDDIGTNPDPGVGTLPHHLDGPSVPGADVVTYTFGAPRVGNTTFANQVDRDIPLVFRVVFDGDFIAGVPKLLWMYKHCGVEVVLDGTGNLIISPSFIESKFRTRSKRSFQAHAMSSYRNGLLSARSLHGLPLRDDV